MINKFSKSFLLLILFSTIFLQGCVGGLDWRTPAQGTVEFKTSNGKYVGTIRPSDGAPYEDWWGATIMNLKI